MIYVLDNNVFSRSFQNLSMDVFDDIWEPWSQYIHLGKIISVDEVYEELKAWGYISRKENDDIKTWLQTHKRCFLNPTNEEGHILTNIFANKKFQECVKESSLRSGSPEADAFLIAKAKHVGGIIVTTEKYKPNSAKIPTIAIFMGIPYMGLNEFYRLLRNVYHGRPEECNVKICKQPGKPEQLIL
jgi:Integral membrane protein (PIN domain superfamily)